MKDKPVQSQQEYDQLLEKLAIETSNNLKIPVDEAKRRIIGLRKSGILNYGGPDDSESQTHIAAFLQIPSSTYAHLK